MMKKRLIAYMLLLAMVLTWVPCEARAAELPDLGNPFGYMEKHIEINYNGAIHTANVLMADGKTLLAPISWLTYYGGMKGVKTENGWKYFYPYQSDEGNFAEQIYINTENGTFDTGFCLDNETFAEMIFAADGLRVEAEGLSFTYEGKRHKAEAIYLTDQGILFDEDGDGLDTDDRMRSGIPETKGASATWEGITFLYWLDSSFTFSWMPEKMRESLLDDYFANEDAEVKRIHGNCYPLYSGAFSSWMNYQGEFWAPIEEVLALLDASIGVSGDGVLCVNPASMTTLRALYLHAEDIEKYLFDMDDVDWREVKQVGGYVLSTITDFRFDRLMVVTQEGTVNDYEAIFEQLLVDNETYLSLYGVEKSPNLDFMNAMQTMSGNTKSVFNLFDSTTTGYGMYVNSLVNYKENAPELYSAWEDGWGTAGMVVDAYTSAVEYLRAYEAQVDDHREMLEAVYAYAVEENILLGHMAPSYRAACNVAAKYAEDNSTRLLAATEDWMFEFFSEQAGKAMLEVLGKGWCLAIDAGRMLFPELYEDLTNNGRLGFWDYAAQTAYAVYEDRIYSRAFSKNDLEALRLSAMMAMLTSRNAYHTLMEDELWPGVLEIDETLNHLYLGIWTTDGTDAYEQGLEYIAKNVPDLWVGEGFDGPLRPKYAAVQAELLLYYGVFMHMYGGELPWDCILDEDQNIVGLRIGTAEDPDNACWQLDVGSLQMEMTDAWGGAAYGNQDLSEIRIDGDPAELLKQLQAYFYFRDGVVVDQEADVDGDGDMDHIYGVADAAQLWESKGGPTLGSGYIALLVAEDQGDGIRLRPWYLATDGSGETATISISGRNLEVLPNGGSYTYSPEGEPYVSAESGGTIEQILAGNLDCLMGVGGSFSFPDPEYPTYASAVLDGDQLVFHFSEDTSRIQRLSVWAEQDGCAVITGAVTTDMTIGQLKENWPGTSMWSDVLYDFPYGGSDPQQDICEAYLMFYWYPEPDKLYQVRLQLDIALFLFGGNALEDMPVRVFEFERIEYMDQDIMAWFEGQ